MNAAGQTICLNMIVKDEAPVIRRCLAAVRPLIDHWVIVDTGSTDGTQDIIRDCMRDLPGELHERPWKNFAHNRSEALVLARGHGDYVFVIDADEVLELPPDFALPTLTADSYDLRIAFDGCSYTRKQLVRNALPWRYESVVHEYITCEDARTEEFLPGPQTVPHHDGARARQPGTYLRDAQLLEEALREDPENPRTVFYMAQCYRDGGDLEAALRNYQRRAEMRNGWRDETWCALYLVANLKHRLKHPWPEVMAAYWTAWEADHTRAGPLYRIAAHYMAAQQWHLAHSLLSQAVTVPRPTPDRLFVEDTIYDYQVLLEYSVASYYIGRHADAIAASNVLLREGRLPSHLVAQVIANRRASVDAMFPRQARPPGATLHVVTVVRGADTALDDTVDSLLRQQDGAFTGVLLHDSSVPDIGERLPSTDARVSPISFAAETGERQRVEAYVRARCAGGDLVLVLPEGARLADPGTLQQIRATFDDPACLLAYGQWRTAAGKRGAAEPAPREADFRAPDAAFFRGAPIAFRADLLQGLAPGATGGWRDLFDAAGFAHTRFRDDVWSVEPAPAQAPPASPAVIGGSVPLVSCLMTTYDRLSLAKYAILSFAAQTHPNKELVVVSDGPARFRRSLERYAAALGLERVRFVDAGPERLTLGRLRNISVEAAAGEIVCQWDDDDYSHPERLKLQVEELIRTDAGACFLTDHLQFIDEQGALYWVDWTLAHGESDMDHLAPGTMMMRRDPRFRYPEDGPSARQGEDSVLLDSIWRGTKVTPLRNAGYLYLYRSHGANTFSREHHHRLSGCRTSVAQLCENADRIRAAARHYPIPRPCFVVGREGTAFAID